MVINKKIITIAIGVLIIVGLGLLFLIGPLQSAVTPHVSYSTPYGIITVPAVLPETPKNLTLYKVTPQPYDMVYFSVPNDEQTRSNVTSEADAPSIAQKYLEQYGGLPDDAVMSYDKTQYADEYEGSKIPFFPDRLVAKFPLFTSVQYSRTLNGIPISGYGGINIELGTDGELLQIKKVWRTVTPSGTVRVISVPQAIEKMQHGEILGGMYPKCECDLTVTKIIPTYYEKGLNGSQEYLNPS